MAYKLIKTIEDEYDKAEVVFTIPADQCIDDMLVVFARFLAACGFVVNEEEFEYNQKVDFEPKD